MGLLQLLVFFPSFDKSKKKIYKKKLCNKKISKRISQNEFTTIYFVFTKDSNSSKLKIVIRFQKGRKSEGTQRITIKDNNFTKPMKQNKISHELPLTPKRTGV